MPIRLLRPTIRQSERWNRCSCAEQSFYIRLITLADDYGRYEAHPILLASEAFPYGDEKGNFLLPAQIETMLQGLASRDLLVVYEKDGKQFLQLQRWKERVRQKTESRYPDPKDCRIVSRCQSEEWRLQNTIVPSPVPKADDCHVTVTRTSDAGAVTASPPSPSPSPSPVPPKPPKGGSTVVPVQRFIKPSLEQVRLFCTKSGISMPDADWFWNHMEGQGWKNGGKAVVNWERTITAWKLAGYLPSLRPNRNGQPSPAKQMTVAERAAERMARELGL